MGASFLPSHTVYTCSSLAAAAQAALEPRAFVQTEVAGEVEEGGLEAL